MTNQISNSFVNFSLYQFVAITDATENSSIISLLAIAEGRISDTPMQQKKIANCRTGWR